MNQNINNTNYNNSWVALFYGLVDVLLINQQYIQFQKLVPQIQVLVNKQKFTQLFNKLIETQDMSLFQAQTNQNEVLELMRQFIYQEYCHRAPPVCNQEILKLISRTFKVSIQFVSANVSVQISSSENFPQILQVSQSGNTYTYNLNGGYSLNYMQECLGCLRMFKQIDLHKSLICNHTYCNECLKVSFKIGAQFNCREFFCRVKLSREDFPLFIASPLQELKNQCLKCRSKENLVTNKCGHTFCKSCIDRKIQHMSQYQTLFCLEPTCTELLALSNHCTYCNKTTNLLQQQCSEYICESCLREKYQNNITFGFGNIVNCPVCNKQVDLKQLYEGLFNVVVNRNIRSISEQQENKLGSQSQLNVTKTTRTTLSRSNVFISEAQTPKRSMAQSYAPQFY